MNAPDSNTLTNVARALQNGAPPALPVPDASEIRTDPWSNDSVANVKPMPGLFKPAAFTGNIEDWTLPDVEAFEKAALQKAEALKVELPATPFDVDTRKWGLERMSEESLTTARDQLGSVPPLNDSPSEP